MDFDFAANKEVDVLDVVPKDFQGLYKEKADKSGFELDSADPKVAAAVAAVAGLNAALKKARADAKAKTPVDLAPLAEYGATPPEIAEAIKAKMTELEAKTKTTPDAKAELEKVRIAMAQVHGKEKEALEKRVKDLEGQLDDLIVGEVATKAIVEHKGDPVLLMPFVKGQVKVQEVDGKRVAVVLDSSGGARFSGVTASHMTINELVAELKKTPTYGKLFQSESREGSGHAPGAARREQTRQIGVRQDGRSAVQKIADGLASRGH
jgi:hypothetical protein